MGTKDIHIILQDEVVDRVSELAKALAVSRNQLIREAIAEYLLRKERELQDQELDDYIREMAPYSGEFVSETRDEVGRMLSENTEW